MDEDKKEEEITPEDYPELPPELVREVIALRKKVDNLEIRRKALLRSKL
jgi:hypothetical protein